MKINFSILDFGGIEGFKDSVANIAYIDADNFNSCKAVCEPFEVLIEGKNFTVVASQDLVNTIAEIKAAVKVGRTDYVHFDDFFINHRKIHGTSRNIKN